MSDFEYIEYVVTDPNGRARGKWAPGSSLKKAMTDGINFPLSLHGLDVWGTEVSATGLHIESGDRDGFFRAVPETLCAVPGKPDTGQVLLETFDDGEPFMGCARQVLRAAVDRLALLGLRATVALELEFHLLDGAGLVAEPNPMRGTQQMYALDRLDDHAEVLDTIRAGGSAAGLPIDTIVKEAAPGQYEINLTHRDNPLRAADDVVLLRRIADAAARNAGMRASFMAKPFADQAGNGAHVHASLCEESGTNVFAQDEEALRHAAGGVCATMRESALAHVNTANGFRRMAPGSYAPCNVNWGFNNRSVALRVPASPPAARRLELRIAGADANPYLVLTMLLSALAHGIENGIEPPDPLVGNAYDPATSARGAALPGTMSEALSLFEASAFARSATGSTMHDLLCHLKRAEIDGFARRIEPFERATYI